MQFELPAPNQGPSKSPSEQQRTNPLHCQGKVTALGKKWHNIKPAALGRTKGIMYLQNVYIIYIPQHGISFKKIGQV